MPEGHFQLHFQCLRNRGPPCEQTDTIMECVICHKKENIKTRCVNGHFVCSECHTSGVDEIIALCLNEKSKNPIHILEKMMSMDFCHMHGPEHHVMVGASLITAYKNAGGEIDLTSALSEMQARGKQVPGGACGFWGACGAGISTGMYMSIITKSTPLAKEAWGLSNQMTGQVLTAIGKNGGPRCCKRDSYLAIMEAVKFTKEKLEVEMELGEIKCSRSKLNNQCIEERCPYIPCKERCDWGLDDPTGKSDEEFIKTANLIKEKVLDLMRK